MMDNSNLQTHTAMERMKAGIWDIHEGVAGGEKQPPPDDSDDIMKGTLPRFKYVANLGQRYLLQRAFEERLALARKTSARIASVVTDEQFHAAKSATDLRFFGVEPEEVKALASTRQMIAFLDRAAAKNPCGLLAIHYVIEGSNNGARYIAKAVRKAYALDGLDGTWHLDPYGEDQRAKWKAFGEAFNACGFTPAELDEMVAIGRETFAHMNAIAAESYSLPEPVNT